MGKTVYNLCKYSSHRYFLMHDQSEVHEMSHGILHVLYWQKNAYQAPRKQLECLSDTTQIQKTFTNSKQHAVNQQKQLGKNPGNPRKHLEISNCLATP